MKHSELEHEYSPAAARRSAARAAQRQRIEHQRQAIEAEPIAEPDSLAALVLKLGSAWGTEPKIERRRGG